MGGSSMGGRLGFEFTSSRVQGRVMMVYGWEMKVEMSWRGLFAIGNHLLDE